MSLKEEGVEVHSPLDIATTIGVGGNSAPPPIMSNNNQNQNVHYGIGDIINNNPIIQNIRNIQNIVNMIAPEPRDAIQINIATALQARHVPQAVYDAQLAPGCMEGTRVKILNDIDAWIKDPEAQSIFWLAGGAGMGKTAISKSVCERTDKDPGIILGGSFFCSRSAGSAAQRDVQSVIPTLAQLLARQSTQFSQALADQLARDPDVLHKQVAAQVAKLLYIPLLSLKDSPFPVVFVIDALDECGSNLTAEETADNADSHRIVSDMLEALVGFSRSYIKLPVKFFVTSRPETRIRDTPVSDTALSKVLRLHTVDKEQVTADIRRYVSTRLSSTPQLRARFTVGDTESLVRISDGLFIVASTALRHALDGPGGLDSAAERFMTLLNATGDGLDSSTAAPLDRMYGAILTDSARVDRLQSDKLQSLRRLLGALLAARMTLSIAALADLMDLPKINVRGDLSCLHALVHVSDDDNESSLRTLHASFGDYLFERAPIQIRLSKSQGHSLLTQGCLRIMKTGLHFNVSHSRSSYEPNPQTRNSRITLALEYACLQWIYHVSSVPEDLEDHRPSSQITLWARRVFSSPKPSKLEHEIYANFRPRFLFWLEVMSVLGQIRRAAAMLILAAVTVRSTELSRFFRDANLFIASSHEAIERSAPHIYISALPFASKDSPVYKTFAPLCAGLISVDLFGIEYHGGHLLMTLTGHEGAVNSISYSPDGRLIASGSKDGTVRIWDMPTGEEAMTPLRGGDGSVWSVAFGPDGESLVSGTDAGNVHIWRLWAGHATPQRLTEHTGAITSVAWSSDGSVIASASKDTTLRLWNAKSGILRKEIRGHTDSVNAVAFSPDSRTLASGSDDGTIRIWHSATGEPVGRPILGRGEKIYCISFSPDGKIIAGGTMYGVRLWKARTGDKVVTLQNCLSAIKAIQASTDGQYLVSADGKHVRLWTLPRNAVKASSIDLDGHTGIVCATTFSPDGLYIASASDDETIRIWNAGVGKSVVQPPIRHGERVTSVAVSSDGTIIVSGSTDKSVRVWDSLTGEAKLPPLEGHSEPVNCVAVSSDTRLIASGSGDNSVRLWNMRTGGSIGRPPRKHTKSVNAVTFSADGRWLASGSDDKSVYIWDPKTMRTTGGPLLCNSVVFAIAFSYDGRTIAAGCGDGHIYLWELETARPVREPLKARNYPVSSIAFLPDEVHIVSGGWEDVGRVWDITTGQQVSALCAHNQSAYSVCHSPDGRFIGTGSGDSTVNIWDAATGTRTSTLTGHRSSVRSIVFTPDSQSIVSGSSDNTIRIFNVDAARTSHPDSSGDPLATPLSAPTRDGWRVGPSGELLLWVPAAYRKHLPEPPCTLLITPYQICFTFGEDGWIQGENWTKCWRGNRVDTGSRRV